MSRSPRSETGFTLVELLVSLSILSMISVGIYTMLFSVVRSGDTSRDLVRQSEETRLGFNRMVRDTREASGILPCGSANFATCYRVQIDFNNDGAITSPNASGDYEDMEYSYAEAEHVITLNGETLMADVFPLAGQNIFQYLSNALQYDANANGITTSAELDSSGVASVGNGNGQLDNPELSYITTISYNFRVRQGTDPCAPTPVDGDSCETFSAAAQLRNRR